MEKEICTIEIGINSIDNDYTFYENGTIKRLYDRPPFTLNKTEWLKPEEISESVKAKLIEKCPEEFKVQVSKILLVKFK